jgi:curved DNA-binding protein CbpA
MPGKSYADFVFSPADLAEAVDLPIDLKKEILYLHARIGELDHWQLLGVPWNSRAEAVRAAYLGKVKVFHPDRYGGKRLGSYLGKIEKIFRALTVACDVLSDESRRAAYARTTAPPEEFTRIETRKLQDELRAQERRARLARANPIVGRAARVQDLVRRGQQAMEAGRFSQALNDFLTVLGLDPRHADARALAEDAKKRASKERAHELYEQGVSAELLGANGPALAILREAAELDPANARYAIAASRMALAAGDTASAREFGDQAVRSAPRDARALEALGAALAAAGDAKEARRALERALEIDATLETAKTVLKKLRWSFLG